MNSNLLNQVTQGDCLQVMQDIESKSIDMILCDLPYGTTACKWDTIIPFEPLWEQYKRIIKDNGAIVLTASQPFTSALVMSNPKEFRYEWIWEKSRPNGFPMANHRPMKKHENILVFSKSPATYTPKGSMVYHPQGLQDCNRVIKNTQRYATVTSGGKMKNEVHSTKKGYPNSLIQFKNSNDDTSLHPTQKPVALFEYLIKTYTNEGDLVLDNCAGSGTTGVACINTNRNFILIEQDENYCKVIKDRLKTL